MGRHYPASTSTAMVPSAGAAHPVLSHPNSGADVRLHTGHVHAPAAPDGSTRMMTGRTTHSSTHAFPPPCTSGAVSAQPGPASSFPASHRLSEPPPPYAVPAAAGNAVAAGHPAAASSAQGAKPRANSNSASEKSNDSKTFDEDYVPGTTTKPARRRHTRDNCGIPPTSSLRGAASASVKQRAAHKRKAGSLKAQVLKLEPERLSSCAAVKRRTETALHRDGVHAAL